MIVLVCVCLFLVGMITDVIWALYIVKLSEHKRKAAAWFSVGTGVCTIFWFEGMIHSPLLSVFWLCGLWIGTYYSERIENFIWRKK